MSGIQILGGGDGGLGAALAEALGGGGRGAPDERSRAKMAELRREDGEDIEVYLHKLREAADAEKAIVPHVFKVGDLVQHRVDDGTSIFSDKRPGIVVEVLDRPVYSNSEEWSSAYFRKPLDIRIGAIRGGEFLIWHHSSRDFVPYTGPTFPAS